jgi:hypothetical protein
MPQDIAILTGGQVISEEVVGDHVIPPVEGSAIT